MPPAAFLAMIGNCFVAPDATITLLQSAELTDSQTTLGYPITSEQVAAVGVV